VAVLSLLVAASGALRLLVPGLQVAIDSQTTFWSVGLIAVLAACALLLTVRFPRWSVLRAPSIGRRQA